MSRQLVVEVVGDAAKFKRATGDAAEEAEKSSKRMSAAFKVAALAAAAIAAAVVAVGFEVFKAGAQYEAMDAKAQTVFGDQIDTVKKWATANAAAMGLTAREATGLAANMGDLLVPMGFTREQAAAMSIDIVGLSGALSEWSGGTRSAAEVSAILQKALLGEREGLKELGISITEADVQARLLANGQNELTGAALAQAKAQATQQLIIEKSTDAQAAYEKGTAKGLRTQAEMTAKLNEVKEMLITHLYPVVMKVATFFADNLPGAIKIAGNLFTWLNTNVIQPLIPVFKAIGAVVVALAPVFGAVFGVIGAVIAVAVRAFVGLASTVVGVWGAIFGAIRGAVNGIISVINSVIRGINSFKIPRIEIGGLVVFGGWGGLRLGQIPYLHAGGVVPGAPGSDVLTMLQAGERVIPASGSSSNVTVYVEGPVYGSDIDQLADKIAMRLRLAGV